MEFGELFELLDFSTMNILKRRKKTQDLAGLIYLSDPSASVAVITPDAVCFGAVSQFNDIPDEHLEGGTFMLYPDDLVKPLPSDVTVITFDDKREQRECYGQLAAEFRALRQIKDRVYALTSLVSRGSGLKAIADRISDIFGVPVNILDSSLSILAHSEDFPFYIADGREQGNGFLPERAQATLKTEGLVSRAAPEETRVFTWKDSEGDTCYNHYTPICIGDTTIGSLSLFTQCRPMRKSRIDLLPGLAQILSIEMQKSSTYLLNKSTYYSHLFTDLMNGTIGENQEAIKYRFSIFGYPLKKYKRILYVNLADEYFDASQTQTLAERMHKVLPNNVYVVQDQNITLLVSSDRLTDEEKYDKDRLGNADAPENGARRVEGEGADEAATAKAVPRTGQRDHGAFSSDSPSDDGVEDNPEINGILMLAAIVRGTRVKIGVSSAFTNILRAPSYLIQAERAIATGKSYDPQGPLYFFSHYRMADMLCHVEDQHTLYSFRYPPLMMVVEEDRRRGSNLAYTLYVHLQNPAHPAATCEKLFIHKNTLYYRLDRIRSIMGVDLKKGWVITQIEMTFLILMHQGKFEELVRPRADGDSAGQPSDECSRARKRRKRATEGKIPSNDLPDKRTGTPDKKTELSEEDR